MEFENSKAISLNLIATCIYAVLLFASQTLVGKYYTGKGDEEGIATLLVVLLSLLFISCLYYINKLWFGDWLSAKRELRNIGGIRGLWKEDRLKRKIKASFKDAKTVKVLVTRGSELLNSEQEYGFSEIFKEIKRNNVSITVKFLLIVPCICLPHVQERYEAHKRDKTQVMKKTEFLETWYSFINNAMSYNTENFNIEIKFYSDSDSHPTWRFYVFSNEKRTSVLLNEYDKNGPGCKGPMYEIVRNPSNIGAKMLDQFDVIWNNAITLEQLRDFINDERCERYFCKKCTKDRTVACNNCAHIKCEYKSECKKFIEKHLKNIVIE